MNTKTIKAFKLISSSGAYWRGSEKIKCLQEFMVQHIQKKDRFRGAFKTS